MVLNFIPTPNNIKEHFNLAEEPLYIFTDINEGFNFLNTYFKGISGIYGFICLVELRLVIFT